MKIATIVGARPQFIKAAMVSRAICAYNDGCHSEPKAKNPVKIIPSPLVGEGQGEGELITEVLVHTGQHYDYQMSHIFFDQLGIPEPDYHLEVGSSSHGDQTGKMLAGIEKVIMDERPNAVLVYGDTNSTIAGSLAAAKLHVPVGHVEGGMRSFNRKMPEEINRVLTDHIAKWHFCATETAVKNLKNEGITEGVHLVGDVMHDAVMLYKDIAKEKSDIFQKLDLECHSEAKPKNPDRHDSLPFVRGGSGRGRSYALATVHRAENTDDPDRLRNILEALNEISKEMPVVLPLHPRTRKAIRAQSSKYALSEVEGVKAQSSNDLSPFTFDLSPSVKIIDPVSYIDMLQLEQHASVILTDSGGMQKEAFWLGVPCITMRDETEWIETVNSGWNTISGANRERIIAAFDKQLNEQLKKQNNPQNDHAEEERVASDRIISIITKELTDNGYTG